MATGNSLTQAREQDFIKALVRQTNYTAPTSVYIGLFGAATWLPSHSYGAGSFVLPTSYNGHVYKSGGAGTSGTSEPTWPTGNGSTVTDNTVTWTEQTLAMDALADAATTFISELSANGYARVNMTSAMGAPAAVGGTNTGSQSQNTAAITFAAATANWNPALGFFLADAATAGKYLDPSGNLYVAVDDELWVITGADAQNLNIVTSDQMFQVPGFDPDALGISPGGIPVVALKPTNGVPGRLMRSFDGGRSWIEYTDDAYRSFSENVEALRAGDDGWIIAGTNGNGAYVGNYQISTTVRASGAALLLGAPRATVIATGAARAVAKLKPC